jgi:DNA adenine methylase
MPPHETYIESHLGGGAVMRHKLAATSNIGVDVDPSVIERWKQAHPGVCNLVQGDAAEFLKNYQFIGSELVYADPPYLIQTRRRNRVYRYEYSENQHEYLLNLLKALPCMVMVSGYDNAIYNKELAGWKKLTFSAMTHAGLREETVWMNYDQPAVLHDGRYIGKSFHDRLTVQRRQQRLQDRISRLPAIERGELFKWLQRTYNLDIGAK